MAVVSGFGRLNILVNHVGILLDRSVLKMSDDDFDQVINVHLGWTLGRITPILGYARPVRIPTCHDGHLHIRRAGRK